jgi:hypothetical protein
MEIIIPTRSCQGICLYQDTQSRVQLEYLHKVSSVHAPRLSSFPRRSKISWQLSNLDSSVTQLPDCSQVFCPESVFRRMPPACGEEIGTSCKNLTCQAIALQRHESHTASCPPGETAHVEKGTPSLSQML